MGCEAAFWCDAQVPLLYALETKPVRLGGAVCRGFGRGSSKLGYPTANLPPEPLAEQLKSAPHHHFRSFFHRPCFALRVAQWSGEWGQFLRPLSSPLARRCPAELPRGVYYGWAALKREPGVHKMACALRRNHSVPPHTLPTPAAALSLTRPLLRSVPHLSQSPIPTPHAQQVMNIGGRPTFADGAGDTVEVHVMHDFGRQFYGEELRVVRADRRICVCADTKRTVRSLSTLGGCLSDVEFCGCRWCWGSSGRS